MDIGEAEEASRFSPAMMAMERQDDSPYGFFPRFFPAAITPR